MRWVLLPGVPGGVAGAIAIGTAATSTSTTTIISIGTTTRTSTVVKLARATTGSITRNIEEMRRMVIEEPRTSSVAMRVSSRAAELAVVVASGEPVVRAGLVAPAAQVAQEVLAALVELAAREALAELELNRVEAPGRDPAAAGPVPSQAAELEHGPVPAELELVQVEAVPERDPVAVPLRTKSVTAAHHRGQAPLLAAAEDLAVAAETMRDKAAAGAVKAWAAAVTAGVVVLQ